MDEGIFGSERWLPVEAFDGLYRDLYDVSSRGRIRSRHNGGALIRSKATNGGYVTVALCRDGDKRWARLHRLVAFAFLGKPPPGMPLVLHNNDVKSDNRVENLRWGSAVTNHADAVKNGRAPFGATRNRKLSVESVREIRRLCNVAGMLPGRVAELFGITDSHVRNLAYSLQWAHLKTEYDRVGQRPSRGRGADNGNAKLSEDQVREIRALVAEGLLSRAAIGRLFGIASTSVQHIATRRTWRHLV